ncbi:hypothetical protein SPRG_20996 [Saprolegnia parasitica CBS 223.65]|uniref:Uncharacterized protein n=1 Tax=Saprolegnia parasitica (strain CBS 223.65) TaxID=695850 RepID=A0A067C902_SAPPC|nr:hypothetical protein SPRG_20996 [Saprolegnia parasitica CBS 223.65]KDO23277.1 hypothetical protein SPRG_20996 [Saprolegnia parasitica CBS 223.65]|eukprot:XP_012206080.1 hypothetical protein SPRG_20996 [Saprolegnia parasitica CBS 223.65]
MRPTNVLARAAVDVWKATLSPQRVAAWQAQDASLHRFLRAAIPEALEHTGEAAFDEHLVGVQSVLRVFWSGRRCMQSRSLPLDLRHRGLPGLQAPDGQAARDPPAHRSSR